MLDVDSGCQKNPHTLGGLLAACFSMEGIQQRSLHMIALTLFDLDSLLLGVEEAGIVLQKANPTAGIPNIVIENLKVTAGGKNISIVRYDGIEPPILPNSPRVDTWAMGNQVMDNGGTVTKSEGSFIRPSTKVAAALKGPDGIFERSKPQYETVAGVMIITSQGVKNDGTGDQSAAINKALRVFRGNVIFFPAGVYAVADTINVPAGTKMVGEGWSQIMGYGSNFSDEARPRPVVRLVRDLMM
jgi:hypothetical protein